MADILIVDDDPSALSILKRYLESGGYSVTAAGSAVIALDLLEEKVFDLMITDIRMPDIDGIALMKKARKIQSHMVVIVMSASGDITDAVTAMKFGAYDYIAKPFKFDQMMFIVERALSYENLVTENRVLKSSFIDNRSGYSFIIGESKSMLEIFQIIDKISGTNSTVLILGESGTGKELIARAVHNTSTRSAMPFVKVNCTAMPENLLESELFGHEKGAFTGADEAKKGLFEVADHGTIFLDEIGSVPMSMQVKLLRALQEKEIRRVGSTKDRKIDVRVIAATNEDLHARIAANEFREDLFFRLSVIPINIPSLRERKTDIPLLVKHFVNEFEQEHGRRIAISEEAMKSLTEYSWPGNIRQLENLMKRLAILTESGEITVSDLPQDIVGFQKTERIENIQAYEEGDAFISLKEYLKNVEVAYIKNVVDYCEGNKDEAARILEISLATLYRKL